MKPFRGASLEVQSYRGREWILSGPSETSKTWATIWLLDSLLRDTPFSTGAMLRKVASDIGPTVLRTYQTLIQLRPGSPVPYGGNSPQWYDYPNGARLYIGGMDRPGKALSGERDFIYVNQAEELKQEDWQVLTTRCTGRGAVTDTPMLFGDCNPGPEDHWILKRQTLKLFESKHIDNPSLYDDESNLTEQGEKTMSTLRALTGVLKERLYLGRWVGAEGMFFEEWDDELHTCDPFDIPGDSYVWGALDHGFGHNTAWGLFTENDGIIYLIAEHVKNGWLVPYHCKAIRRQMERVKVDPYRMTQCVAGHDVFRKRSDIGGKDIAELYEEAKDPETGEAIGFKLEHATLDRIGGATTLLELLGNRELGIKPRLKIFNTCARTIAVMKRMVKNPRDPEDVLKVDADANGDGGDDEYDMIRYGVMARPVPVIPGVLGLGSTRSGWINP